MLEVGSTAPQLALEDSEGHAMTLTTSSINRTVEVCCCTSCARCPVRCATCMSGA